MSKPGNKFSAQGKAFNRMLRAHLERDGGVKLSTIVTKLVNNAAKGNLNATEMIADRLDGKVTQSVEHDLSSGMLEVLKAANERASARKRPAVTIEQKPAALPPMIKVPSARSK